MTRMSKVRALIVATVIAVAVPGTALAAKPVAQFHDHFTDSFATDLCGIAVDAQIVVTDNFFVFADDSFKDIGSFMGTFTNPVNGASVIISSAGQLRGTTIIDEDAGTITFVNSYVGLPERVQLPQGRVLTRDAGIITFSDTFDLATGDFLGSEVTVRGPHPEAEADFELLCDLVVPVLS